MNDHGPRILSEVAAAGSIIGTIAGWFPAFAALLGCIWYCIQIYESDTFGRWIGRVKK